MQAPAYMRIRQYVVDEVYKNPEHERQILSERELCQLFSVTRPTVRRALKDLVDDEFLAIRPGRGTFTNPAKAKHFAENKEALFLGIIVGDGKLVYHDSFYWHLLTGAGNEIVDRNCYMRIINLIGRDLKIVDEIKPMRLDGLIWICPPPSTEKIIAGINDECHLPVISVNRILHGNINYVSMNYEQEGYDITRFMLDKGLHKIVYAGLAEDDETSDLFLLGARRAFTESAVPFNNKFVLNGIDDAADDLEKMIELGVEVQAVYSEGRCLKNIVKVLHAKQMVPFKDCWLATRAHNISQLREFKGIVTQYPLDAIARRAAKKLIDLIHGSSSEVKELFNAELLIKNENKN